MFKIGLISLSLLSIVVVASARLLDQKPEPILDGRIVGGYPIDITQVPWQVSLQEYNSHACGGSIISDRWILTAAHCTDGSRASDLSVRIGSTQNSRNGTLIKVKRIVQHAKYDRRATDFDYSLLQLVDSIHFNESARPIALPAKQDILKDNTTCLVTGWGNTQSAHESPNELRGVEVPIFNQIKCAKAYSKHHRAITPRMLCAGFDEGKKDACQGDSGGPLVAIDSKSNNPVLVGIVSWGSGCAQPKFPGVYSRVQLARPWILKNTGI